MSRRSTRSTRSKYFSSKTTEEDDMDLEIHQDDSLDSVEVKSRKRRRAPPKTESPNKSKHAKKAKQKQKPKAETETTNLEKSNKTKRKRKSAARDAKIELDDNNNPASGSGASESGDEHDDNDSDEDDDDEKWEEVEDAEIFDIDDYNPSLPKNLKITIQDPNVKKQKTPGAWVESYIRQEINRMRKNVQLDSHKCHLLLLVHRLTFLNNLARDSTVNALIFSILPPFNRNPKDGLKKQISKIFTWLKKTFNIKIHDDHVDADLIRSIISCFESKSIASPLVIIIILVACLRQLDFHVRLCYFLNPVSIKPLELLSKKNPIPKPKAPNTNSHSNMTNHHCNYHWLEIFDESKEKWFCWDPVNDIEDDTLAIGSHLGAVVSYVLAIDNDGFINEITARYAVDWVSYSMKKRRIDDDWWKETLTLFKRPSRSKFEDADSKEFEMMMSRVELPSRFSDYKNHPLFVLQRDILKFQAIYPSNAPTVGFFRQEPVYARECVHVLKSRETWLRAARTVKANETAYKIVTAKFKLDKASGIDGKKAMLELFGEWQTEPYDPPEAKNGIVPRNAYGNVELFQECMLPKGTVHLKLPGLARVAAKLNIDCVPAVVGFDCNQNSRGNHPVTEGFVVCREYRQILIDAWNEEQTHIRERERKRREKRIYDNWKRLIKGVIIRQNLKIKYG